MSLIHLSAPFGLPLSVFMEMGEGGETGRGRLKAVLVKSIFEQQSHTAVLPACLPSLPPPAVPFHNSPVCQLATCLVLAAQLSAAPLGLCLACQWAASASRHTISRWPNAQRLTGQPSLPSLLGPMGVQGRFGLQMKIK